MSQPDASSQWRGSGEPQPAPTRRTHQRPPVGWWWWIQVGILCLLICCVVALMVVLLMPLLTIKTPGTITMALGKAPSAGAQSLLTDATLGGTLAGFDMAYGAPSAPTRTSDDRARWANAAIAGQQVALAIAFADGQDGQPHVAGVSASPAAHASATWDTATAQRIMAALLPSDSRRIMTDSGSPNTLMQVYTSAELGLTFTGDQFVNGGNTPFPVGEFTVDCQLTSAHQVSYCLGGGRSIATARGRSSVASSLLLIQWDTDKTRLEKVVVAGKRFGDSQTAHDNEARHINPRPFFVE